MTSFSAEIHYCKGELSDISFIGHSSCENCESHNSKCKMHKKKKCCETVVIEYESDEDCVNASFDINQLSAVQVIIVNYYLNLDLFVSNELDKEFFLIIKMINIELLHDFRVLNYGYFSLHQVGQLHNLYPRME